MKVVRFLEQTTHDPKPLAEPMAETGWQWSSRFLSISIAASTLGVLICGFGVFLFILPIYRANDSWWPIICGLLLVAAASATIQFLLGRLFLLSGLEKVFAALNRSAKQRSALSKESLRKDGGMIGAQTATSLNQLISFIRSETAPAPLLAYRETFLASAQPAYICNFTTGRFLDCNYAFADFIGMERDTVLMQRLGDITICGTTADEETLLTLAAPYSEGNSPVVEMQFRHSSGEPRRSVTFLHSLPNPQNPQQAVHCAIVVPQASLV